MTCLEGTGALSLIWLRHRPNVFRGPVTLGAGGIRGAAPGARVLEAPVPKGKRFGTPG